MAPVQSSSYDLPHSMPSAIQTFVAYVLSLCATIGHATRKAGIWIVHLSSRLGHSLSAIFHAVIDWLGMPLWEIAKIILIFIATCVALLVLGSALKIAYRRWRRPPQPQWRMQGFAAESLREHQRLIESLTSDWRWYGSVGENGSSQSAAREDFWEHIRAQAATGRSRLSRAQHQQREEAPNQRTSRQSQTRQSKSNRAARNERVRKQQAGRKAAQAAQERRRNEEQEQRRADTRHKLSREESESDYQRWKSLCDDAFKDPKLDIPEPPSWSAHVKDCKPVGSPHACTCDIARLLSAGSGPGNCFSERQKRESNRWHPDMLHFTSRSGGGPAWAQELHIAIKNA